MSEKHDADEPEKDQPKPKKPQFKEQFEDEETLLVFRKHPIVMRKGLIIASLALLIGPLYTMILTYTNSSNPPDMAFFGESLAASFILAAILIFPSWVRWYFSIYIMTNKRFIQQHRSLLQVEVVDISLDQMQMINYQIRGLQETLLNFGTIVVQTYVGDLVIHDVHKPAKIQKKMVHILRDLGVHPTVKPLTDDTQSVQAET